MLRGCLIGCGFVSNLHLEGWSRQQLGRLVAVCDLDESKAKAACQHGVCTAYTDAAEMLKKERPDFVEICTRPESHLNLVRLAAEHGVHVMCQKPIAPTIGEIEEMIAVCDRAGVRFMVHENYRYRSWCLRLKAELDAGRIGKPFRLGLEIHDQRCLEGNGLWEQPYFADMPRLILYEIGPHAIDYVRFMFGEPESVFAVTQHIGPQRGEDVVRGIFWFADGRMAHLDMSWCTAPRNSRPVWGLHDTWIDGDKGTLRNNSDGQIEWHPVGGKMEVLPVKIDPWPMAEGYAVAQTHFLECLQSGAKFNTDGPDTLRTMKILFAAYESATSRQPVKLEL